VRRFSFHCIAGECGAHFPNIGAHCGAGRITYDGWKEIKYHKTLGGVLQERKAEEGRAECICDRRGGGP